MLGTACSIRFEIQNMCNSFELPFTHAVEEEKNPLTQFFLRSIYKDVENLQNYDEKMECKLILFGLYRLEFDCLFHPCV
jgi:hypothetical protein